jgi:hypothetical protein
LRLNRNMTTILVVRVSFLLMQKDLCRLSLHYAFAPFRYFLYLLVSYSKCQSRIWDS